jgi:hypothetical protein
MEEHGHVGVEDLMLDLTGVDRLAAHAARTVSPEPDPWADPGDTWEGACAQGGSDPLPDGQCIRSARDHFFPLHRVEVQSSLASTDSRSKACLGGRRRGPSPTVAFGNPHAVTTHVQPIPPAPLHLKLILQLGRPDPSIASETEAIAPISNRGFAGLFPGKLSRCQLVADVIGEAVVRHNGHPKGLNGAVPLKRWEVTFAPKPHPFKLPRSKAPDVGVKLVQSWTIAVVAELNFDGHLVFRDGQYTDRALDPDAQPSPGSIRLACRQLTGPNRFSGFLAQNRFVGHSGSSHRSSACDL